MSDFYKIKKYTGEQIENILEGSDELIKTTIPEMSEIINNLSVEKITEPVNIDSDLIGKGSKIFFIETKNVINDIKLPESDNGNLLLSSTIVIIQIQANAGEWSQYLITRVMRDSVPHNVIYDRYTTVNSFINIPFKDKLKILEEIENKQDKFADVITEETSGVHRLAINGSYVIVQASEGELILEGDTLSLNSTQTDSIYCNNKKLESVAEPEDDNDAATKGYVDNAANKILNYLTYAVDGGSMTIVRCEKSISGKHTIPSEIEGYPVECIAELAFSNCRMLTEITIPDSVTSIGSAAFLNCTALTNVVLNGVETIEYGAFEGCTALKKITIPASLVTIEDNAFKNCNALTEIYYRGTKDQWDSIYQSNPFGDTGDTLSILSPKYYNQSLIALESVKQDKFGEVTDNESERRVDFNKQFLGVIQNSLGGLSLVGQGISLLPENKTIRVDNSVISDLATPEYDNDAATKGYVDDYVQDYIINTVLQNLSLKKDAETNTIKLMYDNTEVSSVTL